MIISSLNTKIYSNNYTKNFNNKAVLTNQAKSIDNKTNTLPISFNPSFNVSFTSLFNPNRLVGDVDLEIYNIMSEPTKERYRELCDNFSCNNYVNKDLLFDKKASKLPLSSNESLENFVKVSSLYLKYKDQPIVCLGRSPKWFLNTAFWMKDGIPEYKFAAFSGYWYIPDSKEGVRYLPDDAPNKNEEKAYRNYLKKIGVTPQKMVETMKNEGKKTVITDYICTGKGACSFLDILSKMANDDGILEDFSNSIQIVGLGSMDYMEILNPLADSIPTPRVPMPPLLKPYKNNIRQDFYNIKDYSVFEDMLLNRNTNECRSTYYPPFAWNIYRPDVFKTGMVKDMNNVRRMLEILKDEKYIVSFTPPMQDYRNLLNFRILDYLHSQDLLRASDNSSPLLNVVKM